MQRESRAADLQSKLMMLGLAITTAAAALASALGYNSMAPRSQLFGATFTGNPAASRRLALTYDDGPNEPHTLALLEVLERHGVHATFFMIGRYVTQQPRIAAAVARAGHVIGNHTFTHPNLIFSSPTQLRLQVEECRRALNDTVGAHSNLFRPPFGGRRPGVLPLARSLGLVPVMWSVTGHDWDATAPEAIEARIARQVTGGGDVVLLHDGGHLGMGCDRSATVAATDRIIRRYRDQGYSFVTVPELMS